MSVEYCAGLVVGLLGGALIGIIVGVYLESRTKKAAETVERGGAGNADADVHNMPLEIAPEDGLLIQMPTGSQIPMDFYQQIVDGLTDRNKRLIVFEGMKVVGILRRKQLKESEVSGDE